MSIRLRRGYRAAVASLLLAAAALSNDAVAADQFVPAKIVLVKPAKLVKFVARASTVLPLPGTLEDPTIQGGALCFVAATETVGGTLKADLPSQTPPLGWKGLGNPPGSKGYKYKGAGTVGDPCKVVLIKERVIKGVCRENGDFVGSIVGGDGGPTGCCVTNGVCAPNVEKNSCSGTFAFGASCCIGGGACCDAGNGDVGLMRVVLSTGAARYCAECGGTERGNPARVFKRKDCAAPSACAAFCSANSAFLEEQGLF